jgi:hypothetical protein
MMYVKWLAALLLLVAGVTWALPGVLDSVTGTTLVTGFTVGNLLGWVALVVALWQLYMMLMKK